MIGSDCVGKDGKAVMKGNIILIGFMGTGKSTAGELLARKLGWVFADMDKRIEEEHGLSISRLFERDGEAAFRKLETEMLIRILGQSRQVIATGGGAVLAEENRTAMQRGGYVVALKADKATIIGRVSQDTGRPLLQGDLDARINQLLQARKSAYDFADLTIDTTGLTPGQIVDRIADRLRRMDLI